MDYRNDAWRYVRKYVDDKFRRSPKITLATIIALAILAINIALNYKDLRDYKDLLRPLYLFTDHAWIEIIVAIIIYRLLEARIKKLFDVPENVGPRNHIEIFDAFKTQSETHREIRILDTSFYTFLINDEANNVDKGELFITALRMAITNSKKKIKIRILLLHPDTYAAEQRAKDLSNKRSDILDKMKSSLGQLHERLKEFEAGGNVQVKLFKATPIMILCSWDDKANFGLLPSREFADNNNTYNIYLRTDLGTYLKDHFENLWQPKEEKKPSFSDNSPILIKDYLFATLEDPKGKLFRLPDIYWGGISADRERPRYIATNKPTALKAYYECKHPVILVHDGKRRMITLKSKLEAIVSKGEQEEDDEDEEVYLFAKKRINETYGSDVFPSLSDEIYEVVYLFDKSYVLLDNLKLVKENLLKQGYSFISHKQYDIEFGPKVLVAFKNMFDCFDRLLVVDGYDKDGIAEKKLNSSYRNNPRKRLFAKFKCKVGPNAIDDDYCELNYLDDPFYYKDFSIQDSSNEDEIKIRKFATPSLRLTELYQETDIEINELEEKAKTGRITEKERSDESEALWKRRDENAHAVHDLMVTIRSTVKTDLLYILGEEEMVNTERYFEVDSHLIRCEVGLIDGLDDQAFPLPEGPHKMKCDYQALHLINRVNINGGVSTLKIQDLTDKNEDVKKSEDYLLLEKPLDAVFFVKEFRIGKDSIVHPFHYTSKISLDKGQKKGYRDVLVIEFTKQVNGKGEVANGN